MAPDCGPCDIIDHLVQFVTVLIVIFLSEFLTEFNNVSTTDQQNTPTGREFIAILTLPSVGGPRVIRPCMEGVLAAMRSAAISDE